MEAPCLIFAAIRLLSLAPWTDYFGVFRMTKIMENKKEEK